ncbi:MAG: hypothetical protein F6J93_28900 [Oscillatoria sp. SIO1A7]|nr:hypothetical protein [Oscillatoria sp. SIO1A7]
MKDPPPPPTVPKLHNPHPRPYTLNSSCSVLVVVKNQNWPSSRTSSLHIALRTLGSGQFKSRSWLVTARLVPIA